MTTIPSILAKISLRTAVLPLLILVALAGVCFSRLAAEPTGLIVDGARPSVDYANSGESRPIGNDLTFLFLPHHLFISRTIAETGRPPLWDPTGFGGRPMLGNPQAGMCYPPVWIAWYSGTSAALGWLTVAHLIWGGLGSYVLARLYGVGRLGAIIAGGCFEAAPYLLGHVFEGHYPHVWGVCWFPWAFWAFDSRRLNRLRGVVLLPLIVSLIYIVGHPQEGFLIGLALTFRVFIDWTRSRRREGVLLRWIGVMLVASGFAAIDLIPQIAIAGWKLDPADPAHSASEAPGRYSLRLINLWQLVSPEALGGPADFDGYDNSWETMLSFGLAPLVLALAAVRLRRDEPTVRGWAILTLLTIWVAGGYKLGLQALLHHLVPGANFFRVPARSLFLTILGVALLAGFGVDALRSAADWRRLGRSVLTAAVVLAVVSALVVLKASSQRSTIGPPSPSPPLVAAAGAVQPAPSVPINAAPSPRDWGRERRAVERVAGDPRVWVLIVVIGSLISLGSVQKTQNSRPWAAYGLGLAALLELGLWGRSLIQVAPAERFLGSDPIARAIHQARPDDDQTAPPRLKTKDSFYSDLRAISNGFEKTNVNDSFQLRHAAALYQQLYPVPLRDSRLHTPVAAFDRAVEEHHRITRQRIFDLMAVDYLVSNKVESNLDWPIFRSGPWDEDSSFVIQANPGALPRAYVVGRAEILEPDPPLIISRFRTIDFRRSVLMQDDPLADLPAGPEHRQSFTVAGWNSADPDRLRLAVTTEKPGLLVIADTWMPGWSAQVDGAPVEILRGNLAQRVVPLRAPGAHTIVLEYSPPGLVLGAGVCLGTLGLWGVLSIRMLRRSRASAES